MYKMLKKILAAFMVTVMLFTAIPAVGITASAAGEAEIHLNLIEETNSEVVIAVILSPDGISVGAIEFTVRAKTEKIGGCTKIEINKGLFDMSVQNIENGMVAANSDNGINNICIVATYTFRKLSADKINCKDFELIPENCATSDAVTVGCSAKNNLPGAPEPELEIYIISYDANGGSKAPEQHKKIETADVYLSESIPTRDGFEFIGWNTKADGSGDKYSSGALYTLDQSITLYALWQDSGNVEIPESAVDGGRCGDGLYWALYDNTELVIFGSGKMDNYSSKHPAPWKKYKDTISKITIKDTVGSIGKSAFEDCSQATELFIPASIGMYNSPYVFANCTGLEKITITKGNGTMRDFGTDADADADKVYYKCTPWYVSKCPTVVIEDGVDNIGEYAFAYCSTLSDISIPDSVKAIDNYAFYNCSGPQDIALPDSVKSIGSYAFYKCGNLKTFSLSVNVIDIGKAAFRYSTALEKVYFNGTEYEWNQLGYKDWSEPAPEIIFLVVHGDDDHEFRLTDEKKETCTTDGYKNYFCRCGQTHTDVFKATGHTFGDWVIIKEPTCTKDGSKVRICSVCKAKETEIIPALGMVKSVAVNDISLKYKESGKLEAKVNADKGVDYTVEYSSSDPTVAQVDENGNIYASGKGSAAITCTVTDEYGNVVEDVSNIEVNYSFGQWLLVIFLFGWIWY
ncbi:MAG: leucine-rich repeat protein [Clostridia bacterium]|nr:leucine-rich repeat protein [Clostridia bacterium]